MGSAVGAAVGSPADATVAGADLGDAGGDEAGAAAIAAAAAGGAAAVGVPAVTDAQAVTPIARTAISAPTVGPRLIRMLPRESLAITKRAIAATNVAVDPG